MDDLYAELWSGEPEAFSRWLATPVLQIPPEVLAAHRAVLASRGRRPKGRFKTTCFGGGRGGLLRQDVEARLARRLVAGQPTWRWEGARPDLEVVVFLAREGATAALRMTGPEFRHRGYLRIPAALSPPVAAALVRLSVPTPDDRLLDPCCGSGTILLERARMGRYRELLGGDASADAVEVARQNLGNRHKPWALHVWDAQRLPLPDRSVSRVVSNLPFGVQVRAPGGVVHFAEAFLREAARVLEPGGRAVVLLPRGAPVTPPPALQERPAVAFSMVGQAVAARVFVRTDAGSPEPGSGGPVG